MIRVLFILCLVGIQFQSYSQILIRPEYLSDRYSKDDHEIIDKIDKNAAVELSKLRLKTNFYKPYIIDTREELLAGINGEMYLKHDSLEQLIQEVSNEILQQNGLDSINVVFLIKSSGFANASSVMINVIELDIALFGLIQNRDQLAFVLAHELAHLLNAHSAEYIVRYIENDPKTKLNYEMWRIAKGLGPSNKFNEAQSAYYELMRGSREMELHADSLGLVFIQKAGFSATEAMQSLMKIGFEGCQTSQQMSVLLAGLFSKRFPPKSAWFEERLPVYNKMPSHLLIYKSDSLETHPHLEDRILNFQLLTSDTIERSDLVVNDLWREMIWSGYEMQQFDLSVFYLMVYLNQMGYDAFAGAMLGAVFLDLYWAKYDYNPENNIYQYVNHRTINYSQQLRVVNNMLHQMSKEDCLITGFYFLSNTEVFDRNYEEHYYLLYQYADLLGKEEIATKVREMYFSIFPEGRFRSRDFR